MKTSATKSVINGYARLLADYGLVVAAERLSSLDAIFAGYATKDIEEFIGFLTRVPADLVGETPSDHEAAPDLSACIEDLNRLGRLLKDTSNSRRQQDLVKLVEVLQKYQSLAVDQFVAAVKSLRKRPPESNPMHEALAAGLKKALGRENEFVPLFEQLSALNPADVQAVTNLLMSAGSSNNKKKDLSRIRARHEAARSGIAKERYMDGRSAA